MDEAAFLRLISGEQRGILPALARAGLWGMSGGYRVGVGWRNLAFAAGWLHSQPAEIPVVSLGNLTTGGTGKTPFAAYLACWFRERDVRVAFLSRGYGAAVGEVNDEALVLERLCPDVPHLQNPDRVAAVQIAREELASQLVILDDGFQHRRLRRDLDIVLIDALNPWGYGHLLPRGLLREPLSALRRADLVVLTRVDQCSPAVRDQILSRLSRLEKEDACVEIAFPPQRLVSADGCTAELASLRGQPLAAFCGIGNPEAFRQMLAQHGLDVLPSCFRQFPDHHRYTRADIDELRSWARTAGVSAVLTTQKDLVKISLESLGTSPLWSVEIGAQVVSNRDLLEERLVEVLRRVPLDAE